MADTDVSTADETQPRSALPLYRGKIVVVGDYACGKTSLIHRYNTGKYLGIQEPTIAAAFSTKIVDLTVPGPPVVPIPCGTGAMAISFEKRSAGSEPLPEAAVVDGRCAQPNDAHHTGPAHPPMMCRVKLELWDTAGSERYNSLMPMYFRDALVALIIFDPSCRTSFTRVTDWLKAYHANNEGSHNDRFLRPVLVCAKADLYVPVNAAASDPSLEFGGPERAGAGAPDNDRRRRQNDDVVPEVSVAEIVEFAEQMQLPLCFTSAKASWNIELLFRDVAAYIALVAQHRESCQNGNRFGLRNRVLGTFGGSPSSLLLAGDPLQREREGRKARQGNPYDTTTDRRRRCDC